LTPGCNENLVSLKMCNLTEYDCIFKILNSRSTENSIKEFNKLIPDFISLFCFDYLVRMGETSKLDLDEENDQIVKLLGNFGKWQLFLILPMAFFGIMSAWEVLVSQLEIFTIYLVIHFKPLIVITLRTYVLITLAKCYYN
jgi:hypothetical protein